MRQKQISWASFTMTSLGVNGTGQKAEKLHEEDRGPQKDSFLVVSF